MSFRVLEIGQWRQGEVVVEWSASSLSIGADVEQHIERSWCEAQRRLGDRLFDGPMCRLEHASRSGNTLRLAVSKTSYRTFLGTSLTGDAPRFAAEHGLNALARPIGVSAAVITSDSRLILGRRNASVAYYPNRLHPFAGSLEPRERVDVFDEVRRELDEELRLPASALGQIVCTGIAEDQVLMHPELIFTARSTESLDHLARSMRDDEHHDIWSVQANDVAIANAVADSSLPFTPIARATMLLHGRAEFGREWYDAQMRSI